MKLTRILSLLVSLFLIPQLAMASHANDLKLAMDDYFFSMTVEWDQKDPSFAVSQADLFSKKVSELIHAGLTMEDLKNSFSQTTGLNYQQLQSELLYIDTKDIGLLEKFIKVKMLNNYQNGASWNGEVTFGTAALVLVGAYLIVMIYQFKKCNNQTCF